MGMLLLVYMRLPVSDDLVQADAGSSKASIIAPALRESAMRNKDEGSATRVSKIVCRVAAATLIASCASGEQVVSDDAGIRADMIPFAQPSRATLQSSPKKVIAHWHQFPISRSKGGPDGDWYSSYAKVRLRPLPRPARTSSGNVEWKIEDALADIRQARQSGVDTFLINIYRTDMTNPWAWPVINYMLKAAARDNRGFTVAPNFDCSWGGDAAQGTAMANQYADFLASIGESSSAYLAKIGTSFLAGTYWAQNCQTAHWTAFKARMALRGMPMHLMCVFTGGGYRAEYDTACDSWSDWGERSADQALNLNWRTRYAGVSGEPIAGVISHGDTRYNEKDTGHDWSTSEQRGFGTLRNTWGEVLDGGADWAHLVTWNDIGEHSHMYPNTAGQWAFYDLNAYYIAWFKTGHRPQVTSDAIYYSHRIAQVPSGTKMRIRHLPWANIVDVVVFLTAPATVEVITPSGTTARNLQAGMQTFTVPLPFSGRPRFRIMRSDVPVIDFESAFPVGPMPAVHDVTYKAGGSLRAKYGVTDPASEACESGRLSPEQCLETPGEPVWHVWTR